MLTLSPIVAHVGVLPFAFAFGHGEYLAGGLLKFNLSVSIGVVLCRRRAVVCSFLQCIKQWGQCYWAMGFYVKTVLVTLVEGCPNSSCLLNFSLPVVVGVLFYMGD